MQIAQRLAGYTLGGADLLRTRDGQEEPPRDGQAATGLRRRRGREGSDREDADRIFRAHRALRGLRLQQEPLGSVRAPHVPDRVPEGALPGRVHGRRAVGGHGPDRQGRHADATMPTLPSMSEPPDDQYVAVHVHRLGAALSIRYGLGPRSRAWARPLSRRCWAERAPTTATTATSHAGVWTSIVSIGASSRR